MLTTIEQAACNALQAYLQTQLTGIAVEQQWPDPNKELPATPTITITRAGARHVEFVPPVVVGKQIINSTTANYTWSIGAVTQRLQLDVWSTFQDQRDDAIAQLDLALKQGVGTTLNIGNEPPFRDGILLALGNGWTGNADFQFDEPSIDDNPAANAEREFRATYLGQASAELRLTSALPRLTTLVVKTYLSESAIPATLADIYTITSGGVTHSTGP